MLIKKRTHFELKILAELHMMTVEEYLEHLIHYEFEDIDTYMNCDYMTYINYKCERTHIPREEVVDI